MRIAMLGQKGMPAIHGGVESHVHDLSLHLVSDGHEVTVYSRKWYTGGKDTNFDGVKIKYTRGIHTKHLDAITHTLTATLSAMHGNFDILHYHGVGPALLAWIPRLFARKKKVIITFHSIDRYHDKWNWIARIFLRLGEKAACTIPHKTITVSQSIENYCVNEFNKNTTYIPNGVYLSNTTNKNINNINQFGLEKNNYFVMVSRLIKHKGVHLLIEAFNNLKNHNSNNEKIQKLKLAIVGGSAYTNKYVEELHQLAAKSNDIIFTDFQSGNVLEDLYRNALTLIHPSLNEGLPITVLQGMSYAQPVLVSNITEHKELISDNRFIFRENDIDDLEKSMLNFIEMPDSEKNKIGKENKIIIEKLYHWDKITPQIIIAYESVLKKTKLKTPKAIPERRSTTTS